MDSQTIKLPPIVMELTIQTNLISLPVEHILAAGTLTGVLVKREEHLL